MAFGFKHGSKMLIKFVAKPNLTGSYTFDNTNKTVAITGYDSDAMTVSGTQTAKNAGTYTVTFTLKRGYMWSDRTKTAVSRTWSIAKRSISIPTMTNKSFTYAVNTTFAPTISGVNGYITQSGTASATAAGSYSVVWALVYPNDTVWSDNTVTNKSSAWSVAKRSITIPTLSGTSYTYESGKTFKTTVVSFDSTYATQSGTTSSTNAGSWDVTWTLRDTANTTWSDGTTTSKKASWSVAKRTISVPSLTNGSQTWAVNTTFKPTITGVDSAYVTQSGVVSSTAAGSWTITWTLKSTANTQWTGGTVANKTATWSVAKRKITIPTLSNGTQTWTVNTTHKPTISGLDTNYVTQSGTASSTSVGSWAITWKLKDATNSVWSDNTTTDKAATWKVNKRSITIPTMTNKSYTWDLNNTYKPTISGVNSTYVSQSGTTSSTGAGSWTVTWALNDKNNTQWTDGTTTNKSDTWTVAKKTLTIPSISSSKSFAFIEGTTRSVTVQNFNSTYETQSGNTSASAISTNTLTWALRYPANTQWSGGTTTNKTESWTIAWVNGTSHYKNDIYNRGWNSGNLETRYSEDSTHGAFVWNADNCTLQSNQFRVSTELSGTKTFHATVRFVVTSGSVSSLSPYIREFQSNWNWASASSQSGSITSDYSEVSGVITTNTYYKWIGMEVYGGKGSSTANKYYLQFQRIWIT